MKDLAALFKAVADETRLDILALLLNQPELCVCDFIQVLNIHQSKASRHLRHLLHHGLVDDRREAVWVYYRLKSNPTGNTQTVLEAVRPILGARYREHLQPLLESWFEQKSPGTPCTEIKTGEK